MLRRIRDQGDAAAGFYLYWIAVDIDIARINDGLPG
jgi:hypothetical protein